jgi:ubiquinone/menaquinone biosynthesis C-methylase UbiE/catechol 2,3-dioxygenase-like lactoylglutathione lyase family enzyme
MSAQARVIALDHSQVAMPAGGEAEARAFYCDLLGMEEQAKPENLVGRGGLWLRAGLHLGVDTSFVPARKAHPGLLVDDLAAVRSRLEAAGIAIVEDEPLAGYMRCYVHDPFGNRVELMQHVADAASQGEPEKAKALSREVFGRSAAAYVASRAHAATPDLDLLVRWAMPHAHEVALDVSTGGGHTALALAPHVASVVASDLTPDMLDAARAFLTSQEVRNALYVIADAEALPFLEASFDLVTVRIAPHHYPDPQRAMREMARVLVPGGRLLMVDNIAPEDPTLDTLVNAWEKERDPSHVRAWRASEWDSFLRGAGLRVTRQQISQKTHEFAPWVRRTGISAEAAASVERAMLAAPEAAQAHFAITAREGHVVSWTSDYLICRAEKD